MSLWERIFSPRSAEETRGEGSDNNDSVDLPSPPAPPARRGRACFQRRVGATALAPSTKKTPSCKTRSSERIRNLQGNVIRALGINNSSARGSSPGTTERPSKSPVIFAQLKREQAIEEQTPTQQDLSNESPLILPPSTVRNLQRGKRISEASTPGPELELSLLDPLSTIAQSTPESRSFESISSHTKTPDSIPASVFSSSAVEAVNTVLQFTARDKPPELSAPSLTVSKSSSSLGPTYTIAQLKNENTIIPTNSLCFLPQYHPSPIGPSTPAVQKSSFSPPKPLSATPQSEDENTSAAIKYLYSIPQYYSSPFETTPPVVPQSSSPLSPPSNIAQFQGGRKSILTSLQYYSRPIGTPTAATMPKSRKRKSSSIDVEPPRTPKRRSPGIQKHDLNIPKQSTPSSYHSVLHKKRERNGLDGGLVCSSVVDSVNEIPTSPESSHSLYSDEGIGGDSEPDSSHNRRRSESPSPSPSPPKRARTNQKQRINGKKQEEIPRSVKTQIKPPAEQKRANTKGKEKSHDYDENYVDVGQSEDSDYHITSAERIDLLNELTRERASRMAEAVEIPPDSGLGPVQVKLVRKLATRGCKPVMSRFWASDFTTWPESLFTSISDGDSNPASGDGEHLMFRSQKMSDNYAIKALQELFAVSGRVRDCSLLSVEPQLVVGKAIRQYLHWAIDDAGLKTTGQTISVHCICPQIPGEEIFATIMRCSRKLERLGKRHQMAHEGQETFWPTMIGFVIAGPIVCLLSLDTDPSSEVWSTDDSSDEESPAKFLTQFDLSEREQDVWNSLAVAICVIHLRDTLIELARSYPGSRAVPIIRGLGDETDDEDP